VICLLFDSEDVEKLRAKSTCLQIVADAGHHTIYQKVCVMRLVRRIKLKNLIKEWIVKS
jgi:hypothetical protein